MTSAAKYDWVVIGTGATGLGSALWAAAEGLKVVVLEKDTHVGGETAWSYGSLWVPNTVLEAELGIKDSMERARDYMNFLSGGFADEEMLQTYLRETPITISALRDLGVPLRIIRGLPDHNYPFAPGSQGPGRTVEVVPILREQMPPAAPPLQDSLYMLPGVSWSDAIAWGGFGNQFKWDRDKLNEATKYYAAGQGLVAWVLKRCIECGVDVCTGQKASRLVVEKDRVTGVVAEQDGIEKTWKAAKGVVLATGGYERNFRLVQAFQPFPHGGSHKPPTSTGDGFVMATEIGAAVYVLAVSLTAMPGYWVKNKDGETVFRSAGIKELACPFTIVVNQAGQRFGNESVFQELYTSLHHFDAVKRHRYKNIPCFMLFDDQFARHYPFAGNPPDTPIPQSVARAGSLRGLAGELGIDADELERTVERFNRNARLGTDPDFGRGQHVWTHTMGDLTRSPNPNLGPLEVPPFYGVELHPSDSSRAGILVDPRGQVMHVRGRAIAGLYAVGNVTAMTAHGTGYQAGLNLGEGLTFGRLAATYAARS